MSVPTVPGNLRSVLEESGFHAPLRVLDTGEAARYRAEVEGFAVRWQDAGLGESLHVHNLHLYFGWCRRLVESPPILDAVEEVVGPNLLIHGTTLTCKAPGSRSFVSWHQDGAFLQRDGFRAVSAYVALGASTVANGCLQVIRGSHRLGRLPRVDTPGGDNLLPRGDVVQHDIDASSLVDVVLAPGEMSLHHLDTIHGSRPNRAGEPRIGLTIRFMEPGVRPIGAAPTIWAARGTDEHRHFPLHETEPEGSLSQQFATFLQACAT